MYAQNMDTKLVCGEIFRAEACTVGDVPLVAHKYPGACDTISIVASAAWGTIPGDDVGMSFYVRELIENYLK